MNKAFEKILERLEEVENRLLNESGDIGCTLGITNMSEYSKQIVQEVAEEYNNGWIPCSERLPDKYNHVLVCTDNGGYYIAHLNKRTKWVCTAECVSTVIENSDVIAWQPLPDPYQPKGE